MICLYVSTLKSDPREAANRTLHQRLSKRSTPARRAAKAKQKVAGSTSPSELVIPKKTKNLFRLGRSHNCVGLTRAARKGKTDPNERSSAAELISAKTKSK